VRVAWNKWLLTTTCVLYASITAAMFIFILGDGTLAENYTYNAFALLAQCVLVHNNLQDRVFIEIQSQWCCRRCSGTPLPRPILSNSLKTLPIWVWRCYLIWERRKRIIMIPSIQVTVSFSESKPHPLVAIYEYAIQSSVSSE
jgi:hypothetical protein